MKRGMLFSSKKLGPSNQNLFLRNFSNLFKRVKISPGSCPVLQYCESLKLLFLRIPCTLFSTKVLNSFLFEEIHASVTLESVQKNFFEICKTLERAFSTVTISLLKSRFPKSSNLGIVGGFIGASLDLAATKLRYFPRLRNKTYINTCFVVLKTSIAEAVQLN